MGASDTVSTLESKPLESGHAPVNGINMYYEVHGRKEGVPLVLLHGGGSTIEVTFSRVLPIFAGARSGAQPQLWEFMQQASFSNMPQPLKDAFLRVNPDVQQLKTMHDKDAARMRSFKDVPDDSVRSVRAPTLIVLGDQDIVKPEHAVELSRLISGARLLILPGGHGDYLGEAVMTQKPTRYPELTARLIEEFLES